LGSFASPLADRRRAYKWCNNGTTHIIIAIYAHFASEIEDDIKRGLTRRWSEDFLYTFRVDEISLLVFDEWLLECLGSASTNISVD
jgi:hypothetical protein